jgi:hypothetical protein
LRGQEFVDPGAYRPAGHEFQSGREYAPQRVEVAENDTRDAAVGRRRAAAPQ